MKKTVHVVIYGCRLTSEEVSSEVAEELKTQLRSKGVECFIRDATLKNGASVRTLKSNPLVTDCSPEARIHCQWGVEGKILKSHDSHGLCYEVEHSGTRATYDPSELEEIEV